MPEAIVARGIRVHNLKGIDVSIPTGAPGGGDRRLRLRQEQPRLRHALRRGPATLRGEPVRVRPAVPGADGEAGPRLGGRHLPGGRHPPALALAQPALHRRHRDRDPRPPAPPLRAGRPRPLPGRAERRWRATRPESAAERLRGLADGLARPRGLSPDGRRDAARRPARAPPEARLPPPAAGRRGRHGRGAGRERSGAVRPCVVLVDRRDARRERPPAWPRRWRPRSREGGGTAWSADGWPDAALLGAFRLCALRARVRGARSRSCSPSTTRAAPVRPATASGTSSRSTRRSSIPDPCRSLRGAVEPWNRPHYRALRAELARSRGGAASRWTSPGRTWRRSTGGPSSRATRSSPASSASSAGWRRRSTRSRSACSCSRYRGYQTCPTCQGGRLRQEARAVLVGRAEHRRAVGALRPTRWACSFRPGSRRSADAAVVERVRTELLRRLKFLADVGLGTT